MQERTCLPTQLQAVPRDLRRPSSDATPRCPYYTIPVASGVLLPPRTIYCLVRRFQKFQMLFVVSRCVSVTLRDGPRAWQLRKRCPPKATLPVRIFGWMASRVLALISILVFTSRVFVSQLLGTSCNYVITVTEKIRPSMPCGH